MDEKHLLAGAQRFDADNLAEIYNLYSPALYAYAMRLLGDGQTAEDCVAETFSRFLKALRAGNGPREHLRAYLYRIAHNWITDLYRQSAPLPVALNEDTQVDPTPKPQMVVELRSRQERIQRALRLLTPEQRQVVMLRFVEELPIEEVAAALEKPAGAVKALQHRALNTLRRVLWKEDENEE